MIRRRMATAAIGVSVGLVLTSLAACSGGSKSNTPSSVSNGGTAAGTSAASSSGGGVVTINFTSNGPPALYQSFIAAFNASHPKIKVVLSNIPFDSEASVIQTRLTQKDSSLDTFIVDQPRTPDWAARGILADLSSLLPEAKQTLFPAAVAASTSNGKLWDMPIWESSNQMIYNEALLKRAGVTPPSADPAKRWTWEETLAAAKKVQAKTGAKCGLILEQTDRYYQLQPMIESAGGGTGLTGSGNLTPAITNPGWVKALTFYQNLFKDGVTPPSVTADQSDAYFDGGKCAFFIGLPLVAPGLIANKIPFGIAPEPYFQGGTIATPNAANAIGISPFSKHQAQDEEFVKWAGLTTDGNYASAAAIDIPPANKAAFAKLYATVAKKSPALKTLPTLVTYELDHTAVSRPVTIGYVQFESIMQQLFSDVRVGTNVTQALNQANSKLVTAFRSLK